MMMQAENEDNPSQGNHRYMDCEDGSKAAKPSDVIPAPISRLELMINSGIKLAIFVTSLLAWVLCSDFEDNFKQSDERTIGFFMFAMVATSVYGLVLVGTNMASLNYLHRFILSVVDICTEQAFAVLCLVSSSLLGDYIHSLRDHDLGCKNVIGTTCGHLVATTVLGFLACISLIADSLLKLRRLRSYLATQKQLRSSKKSPPVL